MQPRASGAHQDEHLGRRAPRRRPAYGGRGNPQALTLPRQDLDLHRPQRDAAGEHRTGARAPVRLGDRDVVPDRQRSGRGRIGQVWVSAASRRAIVASYAQAHAAATGPEVADAEQAASSLLAWSASAERNWLVVLDDLTDPPTSDNLVYRK